ncbi:MAG TPA: AI-2E family transporter [Ktedonobacterales bacterium]|jgi:predicted PurR-regulated permease PerM
MTNLGTALVALALIILLNATMANFVTPHFIGDQLNLPTVFIMIGFLFWGWIYGPFGALLAALLARVLLESSQATRLHAGLMTSVDEREMEETPSANGALAASPVVSGSEITEIIGDTPT